MEHTYAVILAGGGGTRLWPVSRQDRPKQLLPLLGEETLFQSTVRRLDGLFPPERIFVVTAAGQAKALMQQAGQIPAGNFLLEPSPRGTAAAVGLAAVALHRLDPQAVMTVLSSDHYIHNRDLFHLSMRVASNVAAQGRLVVLGITPTYPATGYGYIQRGAMLSEAFGYPVYEVLRFKEKPDETQALELLRSGDHFWNAGMFIWKTEVILGEFARQMPGLSKALASLDHAWGAPDFQSTLKMTWESLETVTIDYGIMEHAWQVAVVPASGLGWSDVGSWDSLFDVLLPDADGNIVFKGHLVSLETSNSLIYGNHDGRLFVTIGLDDIVIVDSGDVLLVARKDKSQQVRQVVEKLRQMGRHDLT